MPSMAESKHYKWVALTNTTIGTLMVTINASILLIALPDIFRGIGLNPLSPGNTSYFLWILMGFLLVTSVLVVSFGRVGDIFGRVKMYTLGFAIFTVFSILLSVTWMTGPNAALWIIVMRVGQGVGGAFIFANSMAIITDAFPPGERGFAIGIQGVAAIGGSFIGLLLGGLLAPVEWRLVFLVSVPFGVFSTLWAYFRLHDNGVRIKASIDWVGNIAFAVGLVAVLTGIVYGLQPYGGHTMGWTSPFVLTCLFGGVAILAGFIVIEHHVDDPMFQLHLFRSRAFTMGNLAGLLAALARGGLQFMLIIWLQGIWLPLHGYSFQQTPLWAGIYMVPLTVGFFVSGPLAGRLADSFGPRPFATAGLVLTGISLLGLQALPMNFPYPLFALMLLLFGLSLGMFAAPNTSAVMNSLPANQRGAGGGMLNTFQNSASVLSIGFFFTLITLGLASALPHAPVLRPHHPGGADRCGPVHLAPLPHRQPVRRLPRDQPHPRAPRHPPAGPARRPRRLPDRPQLLPQPDRRPVRQGPPPGLHHGRGDVLPRRRLLLAPGTGPVGPDALGGRGGRGGPGRGGGRGHGRGRGGLGRKLPRAGPAGPRRRPLIPRDRRIGRPTPARSRRRRGRARSARRG